MQTEAAHSSSSLCASHRAASPARDPDLPRPREIGVVLAGAGYQVAAMLHGVRRAAREADVAVRMEGIDTVSPAPVTGAVSRLRDRGAEGIVVISPEPPALGDLAKAAAEASLVLAGCNSLEQVPSVTTDHQRGGATATQYLLGLGHRTVHHVVAPGRRHETVDRISGWLSALTGAGAQIPPVEYGDETERSGFEAGVRLITRHPGLSAIMCANDAMAAGVLRACAAAGRRVPEDISVLGYDDLPEAAECSPPLSAIRQNFPAIGAQAFRILTASPNLPTSRPEVTLVPAELVIRNSTGVPGARNGETDASGPRSQRSSGGGPSDV